MKKPNFIPEIDERIMQNPPLRADRSPRGPAAIHGEIVPTDERCGIAQQERNRTCDFISKPDASQWHLLRETLHKFRLVPLEARIWKGAGRQAVTTYASWSPVHGEVTRH